MGRSKEEEEADKAVGSSLPPSSPKSPPKSQQMLEVNLGGKLKELGGSSSSPAKEQQPPPPKRPVGPINRSVLPSRASPPKKPPTPKVTEDVGDPPPYPRNPSPPPSGEKPNYVIPPGARSPPKSASLSLAPSSQASSAAPDPSARAKMNAVAAFLVLLAAYALFAMERSRREAVARQEAGLERAITAFPKDPYDYNQRQRAAFAAGSGWRRFNFRNISILGGSVLSTLLVVRWHRRRRELLQLRTTLVYWAWTVAAGLFGLGWGFYVIKKSQESLVKKAYRNPTTRALLIIGLMLLVSLLIFAFKLRRRKTKKERMMEEWRSRKHREAMLAKKDGGGAGLSLQAFKPLKNTPPPRPKE